MEVLQLETQIEHDRVIHDKTVAERMRFSDALLKNCRKRHAQNGALLQQVQVLQALVGSQAPMTTSIAPGNSVEKCAGQGVCESVLTARVVAAELTECPQRCRRMKGLVTTKKLRDIAKAQQFESASLKAELDRLHLRTFPSFLELQHASLQPDEMPV